MNNDGIIRDYGWGILEMKIAACYLVGFPLVYFDEPVDKNNVINLVETDIKKVFPKPLQVINYKSHLAYEFYLLKPLTVSIVTEKNNKTDESELKQLGINYFTDDLNNFDLNSRTKFIISSRKIPDNELKWNNIRQIEFLKKSFSSLLSEKVRASIILKWQQQMFFEEGQTFDIYNKVNLNLENTDTLTSDQEEILKGNNLIVIDSHANGHKNMSFIELKNQGYIYYSTSCNKDLYDLPPIGNLDDLKWYEIEAIFTHVAILDERIQKEVNESKGFIHSLSKRDLLELRGIFIPENKGGIDAFNLEKLVFGEKVNTSTVESLEKIIENYMQKYHYVVLHFSILEKMANIKEKKIELYYQEMIKKVNRKNHYLILTSGKGTPSTLPEGTYFISFTSLERTIRSLSKIELVQHLNALRIHSK
jgi:hypothetical protein